MVRENLETCLSIRVLMLSCTGQRLEESKKINQSLSALGNVIAALTDARGRQVRCTPLNVKGPVEPPIEL
jgi:hypothetical protein